MLHRIAFPVVSDWYQYRPRFARALESSVEGYPLISTLVPDTGSESMRKFPPSISLLSLIDRRSTPYDAMALIWLDQRTTTTVHLACAATCWLTDPRSIPANPPWPLEPTTSRSASSEKSMSNFAALPSLT